MFLSGTRGLRRKTIQRLQRTSYAINCNRRASTGSFSILASGHFISSLLPSRSMREVSTLIPLPGISTRRLKSVVRLPPRFIKVLTAAFALVLIPQLTQRRWWVHARLCRHLRETPGLSARATVSRADCATNPLRLSHVGQALYILPDFRRLIPL